MSPSKEFNTILCHELLEKYLANKISQMRMDILGKIIVYCCLSTVFKNIFRLRRTKRGALSLGVGQNKELLHGVSLHDNSESTWNKVRRGNDSFDFHHHLRGPIFSDDCWVESYLVATPESHAQELKRHATETALLALPEKPATQMRFDKVLSYFNRRVLNVKFWQEEVGNKFEFHFRAAGN